MKFIRYILDYGRIFTLLVILLPIVAGTFAYQTLPKEGEPEISAPIAIVVTQYVGASPGEIESLITDPLEEALSDLKNVKEMRSSSLEGVSVVVVEFDVDVDLERAIQRVMEKVNEARGELPEDAEDPTVEEIVLSELPIMIVSIVGDVDPVRLKRLAEDAADEIETLPEVLSADVAGGLTREIQIYLDPERLDQYGLTLLDVYGAVGQADVNIPGGLVDVEKRRFVLKTLTEIKKVEDYARVPLVQDGDRVVFLGDMARIVDGHAEDVTYSRVNGRPSVSISVKKRTGANILETSAKVRQKIKELEENFPAGVSTIITAEQAKYIRQTFDIMNNSAITGLIIVIFVLFFAMGLRNSFITALSIPLSLWLTFALLKVFGLTNNNMVRFSLVLCIGLLVDNAIIVVENAYHHYQLGKDRRAAVVDGTAEIALPVISATMTTVAAFLPILLMSGTIGEYMGFLSKTVTIALSSSLVVALIANPLVLSRFMKQAVHKGRVVRPEEDLVRLKGLYERWVCRALNHRAVVVLLALVVLAVAFCWLAPPKQLAAGLVGPAVEDMIKDGRLRPENKEAVLEAAERTLRRLGFGAVEVEMFPDIDFDFVYITIETPPGTEVEVTNRIALEVEKIVLENVPEAEKVVSTVGYKGESAFEVSFSAGGQPDFAEITIELKDGKEYARATHKQIQERLRPRLEAIPGAKIRFRPLSWGPPVTAPVVVRILGPDLEVLRDISDRIKKTLSGIPGAMDVKDDFSDAPPELQVRVDREAAAALGVPLEQLALSLRGATAGLELKDFRDELDVSKKYGLKVRYTPEARTTTRMLDKVKVRSAAGALVPLSNLAAFSQGPGVNAIRHEDRRRVVRVSAQTKGRSGVEVTRDLQSLLAEMKLPPGYEFVYGGEYKETEESFASLKLAYVVAFFVIFTLLVAQFNSYFQPLAIMTALPLSVVGAMVGLLVTGNNFSIMSFVGLVGLTGIVVNDSIVLVDCINRCRAEGLSIFEAVVRAGKLRLRPILSTTVTTIGGIFTLTITDELWEGLGVVIMFGIGFATLLTLVVVPVMYSLFEGLGYQVMSAFRGPRYREAPVGRSFFFTRRRWAWLTVVLIILVQAAVMLPGLGWLADHALALIRETTIQAPTLLKLVIEAVVFGLTLALNVLLPLAVFLAPTWLGLVFLMNRRSREGCYVDVTPQGVTVTSPSEKVFLPAGDIDRVHFSRLTGALILWTGRRRVRLGPVVEDHRRPDFVPLATWLGRPGPKAAEIKQGLAGLREALVEITTPAGRA
ncbi:MAG: efflux RND transporter permease subunit [Thermodesulfobacteriota bacterium]